MSDFKTAGTNAEEKDPYKIETDELIHSTTIVAPALIKNVVNTDLKSGWTVSCNMFKSESLYAANRKAWFDLYVRGFIEPNGGGHYYARSFDTSAYQSASCTIPLAKCSIKDPKRNRAGNISLGICTENSTKYSHFDVGLRNLRGDGWHPMIWGNEFITGWNPGGPTTDKPNLIHRDDAQVPIYIAPGDPIVTIPSNATVTVLVETGRTSTVDWMRATFSYNGKTGKIAINVPRGRLFPESSEAKPTLRFNRFMSLVPASNAPKDDCKDDSRLEGWMENLKIGSVNWTADKLQHVWDVQDENVPLVRISTLADSGGTSNQDHAIIYHTVATH